MGIKVRRSYDDQTNHTLYAFQFEGETYGCAVQGMPGPKTDAEFLTDARKKFSQVGTWIFA